MKATEFFTWLLHEVKERWVRTRYEVPNSIDPKLLLAELRETVKKNEWIVQPDSVKLFLSPGTLNSYVVIVDAMCKGAYEEPPRSSIFIDIMTTVQLLSREKKEQK